MADYPCEEWSTFEEVITRKHLDSDGLLASP